jgi:hypothetical protein
MVWAAVNQQVKRIDKFPLLALQKSLLLFGKFPQHEIFQVDSCGLAGPNSDSETDEATADMFN